MNRDSALQVRDHAVGAISELSRALSIALAGSDTAEAEQVRFAFANVIGRIEEDILSDLYRRHPDLDDIRQ